LKNGIFNKIKGNSLPRLNQRAGVFIICFFLAVVFWVFTALNKTYETTLTVPLSYRNIPFSSHVQNDLPHSIDFFFRARGFDLAAMHFRDEIDSIRIDVSNFIKEQQANQINIDALELRTQFPGQKQELSPVRVMPVSIRVDLRPRSVKKIPVIPNLDVSFKKQFDLAGKIILKPDSIEIAGPPDVLEKYDHIKMKKRTVRNIDHNFFGGANLETDLPESISVSGKYCWFYIPVREYTEGSFEIEAGLPISKRDQINIIPSRIKVRFQVPVETFKTIQPEDFEIAVLLPGGTLPPRLELALKKKPENARNIRLEPETVDYFIYE